MVWICIDWADVQVTVFGEEEAFNKLGKESSLITLSHLGDFDWLIGYLFADNKHILEVNKRILTMIIIMSFVLVVRVL